MGGGWAAGGRRVGGGWERAATERDVREGEGGRGGGASARLAAAVVALRRRHPLDARLLDHLGVGDEDLLDGRDRLVERALGQRIVVRLVHRDDARDHVQLARVLHVEHLDLVPFREVEVVHLVHVREVHGALVPAQRELPLLRVEVLVALGLVDLRPRQPLLEDAAAVVLLPIVHRLHELPQLGIGRLLVGPPDDVAVALALRLGLFLELGEVLVHRRRTRGLGCLRLRLRRGRLAAGRLRLVLAAA